MTEPDLYESVYEEAAALRRLVALADAMFAEMKEKLQAQHDAEHCLQFGSNGATLAGALNGADRAYVFHRHREGLKLGLPDARTALGQRPDEAKYARQDAMRDRYLAHLRWLAKQGYLAEPNFDHCRYCQQLRNAHPSTTCAQWMAPLVAYVGATAIERPEPTG